MQYHYDNAHRLMAINDAEAIASRRAWVSLRDAGAKVSMTFTRSVANLLLFAANVWPWLLLAYLPLVWLIGRRWRRAPLSAYCGGISSVADRSLWVYPKVAPG